MTQSAAPQDETVEWPRRSSLHKFTPAERAIWDAVQVVEAMPADVRLTEAVILLNQAREKVADYVDGYCGVCHGAANWGPAHPCQACYGTGYGPPSLPVEGARDE